MQTDPNEVTQMVTDRKNDSRKMPEKQDPEETLSEPNKIGASTPYDFKGKNLTPYGGLLPVITMLEKLDFQSLVGQTVTSKRIPRAMDLYRFLLGIVLGLYIGFPRLNQLRFIARDPILTGILEITKLPVQSTFWRFVNALHRNVARQILTIMRTMRERVWAAANVKLEVVTIDTDTTVHTLYGQQMGGRKSYNPKNKGKKSYQPMLTFIAETREYVWGELRNGDRPTGKQIGDHIRNVCAALPPGVKQIYGRVDSGFYCREAVEAYEECNVRFVISARKTSRLVEQLCQAEWKPSKKTAAGWECEFRYQPDGWKKPYRFVALRYEKAREEVESGATEQYQLFETCQYTYRVFVTDFSEPIDFVVWFYNQRGGAENLIKEANNDAGLAAHPSGRFDVNCHHFQLAMLAYNLNCWLMLFNREPQVVNKLRGRLQRHKFVAAFGRLFLEPSFRTPMVG
ncbi:MAG: IS1380 family transposase [Sulfuriferula sp.]